MKRLSLHQIVIILLFFSCIVNGQKQVRNKMGDNKEKQTQSSGQTNHNSQNAVLSNSNALVTEASNSTVNTDSGKDQSESVKWAKRSADAAWYQAMAALPLLKLVVI
jgi:hypothetical protein